MSITTDYLEQGQGPAVNKILKFSEQNTCRENTENTGKGMNEKKFDRTLPKFQVRQSRDQTLEKSALIWKMEAIAAHSLHSSVKILVLRNIQRIKVQRHRGGGFHLLTEELKLNYSRFQTYFRMSVGQFKISI